MTESSVPGIGDLLGMLGGTNPLAAIGKTIEQFKRGVNDFLKTVENFNETMETINGIANRANALFDDIEEPIRAFMPQVTRSIKAADAVITQISGPIEKVAPGINRLAETLGNPVFASMPNDLSNFIDTLGDIARRMQPLAQMAETAGSMFGLKPNLLTTMFGGGGSASPQPTATPAPPPPPAPLSSLPIVPTTEVSQPPVTKSAAKKAPAKKAPAKKAPAAKKTAAKKAPATKKSAASSRATPAKRPAR